MQTQNFIAQKSVASLVDTGKKTPMGGVMLKVCFEDGSYEYMPEKRFNIIKSDKPTDLNYIKGTIMAHVGRDVGSIVYGLLLEFGCRLSEIDSITNQVVVMTNAASDKVSNLLWGVDYADERTLNQINDILIENANKNNNNATSSSGTGVDSADKK